MNELFTVLQNTILHDATGNSTYVQYNNGIEHERSIIKHGSKEHRASCKNLVVLVGSDK